MILDRSGSDSGTSSTELVEQTKGGPHLRSRSPLARHISEASTSNWTSSAIIGRLDMLPPSVSSSEVSTESFPTSPRHKGVKKKVKTANTPLQKHKERIASRSPMMVPESPIRSRPLSPKRNVQSPRYQSQANSTLRPRSPLRTSSLQSSPVKKTGKVNSDKGRVMSPNKPRPSASAQLTSPSPPRTPVRQSTKLIMSPSSTPKRQRETNKLPVAPQLMTPSRERVGSSPRQTPTRRQPQKYEGNSSFSKIVTRRRDPDIDLSTLFHASMPTLPDSIMGGDHSVVASIYPSAKTNIRESTPAQMSQVDEKVQDKVPVRNEESVPEMAPEQSKNHRKSAARVEPKNRGLLRSLSLTMGLRGGKNSQKSKKFSSSTVGGGDFNSEKPAPTMNRNNAKREIHFTPEGPPSEASRGASSSTTKKSGNSMGIRGRISRNRSSSMSQESVSLHLREQPPSENKCHGRSNSSSTSLPVTTVLEDKGSNRQSFTRTGVLLDIYRKGTGETSQSTEGYQIIHLITNLDDTTMSVWDAVRDAHKSYPANRLFRVDASLEEALQQGRKSVVLHVGSGGNDDETGRLTIKQSIEYWKRKDLRATVEAMVSSRNKPHLSIRVEYADLPQVLDLERDMFDTF